MDSVYAQCPRPRQPPCTCINVCGRRIVTNRMPRPIVRLLPYQALQFLSSSLSFRQAKASKTCSSWHDRAIVGKHQSATIRSLRNNILHLDTVRMGPSLRDKTAWAFFASPDHRNRNQVRPPVPSSQQCLRLFWRSDRIAPHVKLAMILMRDVEAESVIE